MKQSLRTFFISISPLLIFSIISIIYFGVQVIPHFQSLYIGTSQDATLKIWVFAWWKHCIEYGLNPFINSTVWFPFKFNLIQRIGAYAGNFFLVAPVLFLFGPVAAYNFSMLVAPALAGWTAFFLLRYLTKNYWSSVIGAYFFGFSSYVIGHMLGHLDLVTIFLLPLIVLLTIKFYRMEISKLTFCLLTGFLLALQCYISSELFATTLFFGFLTLFLSFIFFRDTQRLIYVLKYLVVALIITLIFIAPYIYWFFLPPLLTSKMVPTASTFVSDLLSPIIPSQLYFLHITINALINNAQQFNDHGISDVSANNCYFGLPLLIICLLYFYEFRKSLSARFCLLAMIVIFICALGPYLNILGLHYFPMPWYLTIYLPLLKCALPTRFGLFLSLFIAAVVAYWLAYSKWNIYFKISMIIASILFLMPTLNYATRNWTESAAVPKFISEGIYKHWIKPKEVVVILPYGNLNNAQSMLWQVQANMYFDMAGGYFGYAPLEFARDQTVKTFYQYSTTANLNLADEPNLITNTAQFFTNHQVKAIFVSENFDTWKTFFAHLGMKPISIDNVDLYLVKQPNFRINLLNWYGYEKDTKNYWQWSNGHSEIQIVTAKPKLITIYGTIDMINLPRTVTIFLNNKQIATIKNKSNMYFKLSFPIAKNSVNVIKFTSPEKAIQPSKTDQRTLTFKLMNYNIVSKRLASGSSSITFNDESMG